MSTELNFRALERRHSGALVFLFIIPVVVGVVAAVAFGLTRVSASEQVVQDLSAARAQVGEYRKALEDRDALLAKENDELDVLRSAGEAALILEGSSPSATESGVVLASPGQNTVRLYLYGLAAPPGSGQYLAVARGADGARKVLGRVLPDDKGSGFLLSREVPSGTTDIELALRRAGSESVLDKDIRVSARYPRGRDERGVLVAAPSEAVPAKAEPVRSRRGEGAPPAKRTTAGR
ncbi:MAG TPA: hypothetical protein VFG53_20620 [Anaeromyxobacter sp.]|nr:hypothetical protein [Anaeromyxobacter sp.]